MLDKALSALLCVFLGKIRHDEQFLQHVVQLYNHAIQCMSKAIRRNAYADDIVYTGVIFQQIQVRSLSIFFFSIPKAAILITYIELDPRLSTQRYGMVRSYRRISCNYEILSP
jgi:hypothetical protein